MAEVLTPEARDELREAFGRLAGPVLDEARPEDAAELELVALDMIGPLGNPHLPSEVVALLPDVLEARRDELGAGVLAALAALGPPPLAGFAAEARDRLAEDGIVSSLADSVGAVRVSECYRFELDDGEAEALAAIVTRDGDTLAEAAILIIEHLPCGGAVADGFVTAPEDPEALRVRLHELLMDADPPKPLSAAAASDCVVAAMGHMVDHELELPSDSVAPLAVLERALTGCTGSWPRPVVAELDELAGEEGEEHLHRAAEDLVDAFGFHVDRHAPDDPALREHGPVIASFMTDWKIVCGDRELTRWTHDDVRVFLLDWYPRKGDSDDETLAVVQRSVVAFLRFLDDRSLLSGANADALAVTVERLAERFERAARNPRNWGPAKALFTQMRNEGVEPTDQAALDAWMSEFNSRPFEERDRVLGPSIESNAAAPPPTGGRRDRRAKRKTARATRKRNRR